MTLSLKVVVLNKLAKENHFNNWGDFKDNYKRLPYLRKISFGNFIISAERAVELTLEAKQAEANFDKEEIESVIINCSLSNDEKIDAIVSILNLNLKRLLVKEVKRNGWL